jgi:hypothetical protein
LFSYNGSSLSEDRLKDLALQNVLKSDDERASIGVISKDDILKEDYLPILENNYIFIVNTKKGKLIDRSYCCSRFSIYYPGVCDLPAYNHHPDETFRGRNAEQIRFKKGDIVEVYRGDEVKLAIVVGTPLTTEWIWERNQAAKDKRGLDELPYDETDDSYTVIDGPSYEYHDHVPSLYVFAPHYHVPLYLQRRFKGYLEKAEKKQKEEEEKDRIFRQAHDCCFSNKEQIEKSEKCGCFSCCEIFTPSEITDYLPDEPPTAECPFSRLPLVSYEDRAVFKIFVLDVGLLGAMSNLKATTVVDGNSIFTEFKGALTEQYVLQQLVLRYEPYYYAKTNSTQEIDFLLQGEEDEIVPLEVKAETNVKAKSLRQFVADNQSKKAYRISMNDYQQEDWVTNVPLYAVNGLEF